MLEKIIRKYIDCQQWKSNRKIIVLESDDWGSIRMSSPEAYIKLKNKYPQFDNDYYSKFDTIAQVDDFEQLFETLSCVKDKNGDKAILTANTIVANPDFEKIRESEFTQYSYKPFYETISELNNGVTILNLWNTGINERLFKPQFHGREHVLVNAWLNELKNGNQVFIDAFNYKIFSVPNSANYYKRRKNLQAAFDFTENSIDFEFHKQALNEGTQIFKKHFGYESRSFIAPAYTWSRQIESELKRNGIDFIQGTILQTEPTKSGFRKRLHYTGQQNKYNQIYLVRNAFFEPASNNSFDWVSDCLKRIKKAFNQKTPAIIGSHRVNFIGSLDESNRIRNLKLLKQLLSEIVKQWPDVEFMSSDELGELINYNKNNK